MAKLIKCKICGDTEFAEVGELLQCRSCKHKTPRPKENAELLERANNLRFETKSFDEAAGLYEEIIRITPDEAEAYWGRVLCRYGIEYVKDSDGRYLPTCHRTLDGSILDDGDYKMAVMKAERGMAEYYMSEAQTIDEYQKKIKIIAAKEEPYDVFISFKATDEYGRVTEDSLLAQELYYYLTKNLGLKVFFSNITLKDKAGQEYEPIIYAALSSATVMVLVGTKPEYVNATWVKNEWSRYAKMVAEARAQSKSKYIVTALKDMRPEQLPSVLASYQAVNLAELGAKEKLCSNIDSLIGDLRVSAQKSNASVSVGANDMLSAEAANLCNLGFQQLVMRDFSKANEYFQKAVEKKSDTALAQWGMLLAFFEVESDEELGRERYDIKDNVYYKLAMQYATAEEKIRFGRIDDLIAASFEREANELCEQGYEKLKNGDFDEAYELFDKALDTNGDMSNAYWGMLLAVEKVCSDDELSSRVGKIDDSDYFKAAMQFATHDEKERYNAVMSKIRAANIAEADFCLSRADEYLRSADAEKQKLAKKDIINAISFKGEDIPGKYYWNWLRLFLGAENDENMSQLAYPIKDDIFYQMAIKHSSPDEVRRYERIADKCQRLYKCRSLIRYHGIEILRSSGCVAYHRWKPTEKEEFMIEMDDEAVISTTSKDITNSQFFLDKYMTKYLAGIIPDPYDEVEGEDECGRYKYVINDTVSVYLENAGKWEALTRKEMEEHLGLSNESARQIIESHPCYVAHDVPIDTARAFCHAIRKLDGLATIHSEPLNDIIEEFDHTPADPNERVCVYLTNINPGWSKHIIKLMQEKCGADKRMLKEAIKSVSPVISYNRVPMCIAANIPLSTAQEIVNTIINKFYCEAEIRWQ